MKSLIFLAFSLLSMMAHAGSVDAITKILSIGTHVGTNVNGDCSIVVKSVNYPANAVTVTAIDDSGEVTKLVEDGTEYQQCARHNCSLGKNFLQVDHVNLNADGSSYVEKILLTALSEISDSKLYVVVAERTVLNRDSNEVAISCDLDL